MMETTRGNAAATKNGDRGQPVSLEKREAGRDLAANIEVVMEERGEADHETVVSTEAGGRNGPGSNRWTHSRQDSSF